MKKPPYTKPLLYSYFLEQMREVAKDHGYNLLLHGSMNRDMDLVAVPWVDNPMPEFILIQSLSKLLTGHETADRQTAMHSILPGGRSSYVINLNRGRWADSDPQYYLDICVTPLIVYPELENGITSKFDMTAKE